MRIVTTIREIFDRCDDWDSVCSEMGWNPWMLKEGLADGRESIELEQEQAEKFGLLKRSESSDQ